MLLSWRDQIRIALMPHRVLLVRMGGGLSSTVGDRLALPVEPASPSEDLWQPSLAALRAALPGFARGRADVSIVLSNHFCQYTLVPQAGQLLNEWEEMALVRHVFTGLLGNTLEQFDFRVSGTDGTRVASAVHKGLLSGLEEVLAGASLTLRSIQPHLMSAFNRWRPQLQKQGGWFVVAEEGRLCIAFVHDGAWRSVRGVRVGEHWTSELPALLERERHLAGLADVPDDALRQVLIYATGGGDPEADGSGAFRVLRLPARSGFSPLQDGEFTMAVGA